MSPGGSGLPDVFIPREERHGEKRVAATPETVKRLSTKGFTLQVEQGAGVGAGYADADYAAAGAALIGEPERAWASTDVVLCVNTPPAESLGRLKAGALLAGLLSPYGAEPMVQTLNSRGVSAFALELLPRISRAQSMDVLSSQANIAGYKAVLLAAAALDRYMPMLMTAAGTIQ
ncbi:NAD(P)(+) transhydrogenase (Re/Si-specific) subunit alpha, partial [Cyanobium sp. HWJ4-Hawea]|nr:NAD(P)(+) transhydrogenase (Re/Si-specific) subunit alpha [Cyanobium sp. HWJ4-Hawea]